MLPTSDMSSPRPILHVPYGYVMYFTLSLPVAALLLCATLGYNLHFEGVTATHCRVPNFVPSISSTIGDFTPERYIWRLCMAFFSFPRIFDAFLYYNYFSHSLTNSKIWFQCLNKLTWFLHVWQNVSLFGLSYISSNENFLLHRNCFISFIVCSMVHMLVFLIVFRTGRQPATERPGPDSTLTLTEVREECEKHQRSALAAPSVTPSLALFPGSPTPKKKGLDRFSFSLRLIFAILHILIFFTSLYFYWRHNTYCEPYMYSYYGICEYLVVLTNIAFHVVQGYDFGTQYYISVAPPSRLKHN